MEYIKLGNSNLNVSRICLGCMGFGEAQRGQHRWTLNETASMTEVSLAWLLARVASPVVGAIKLHHIEWSCKVC